MPSTSFIKGAELAEGRYLLERRLGSGGMATVWLAEDTRLARRVAIKIPGEALLADATFARRFEREAQTAAALSHPNLVSVFDYGCEGKRPYLVSEYIDGSNLAQLRERNEAPPNVELAHALLEALGHIHAAGIVHRDVKPANVMVDRRGHMQLTDFGIAQSNEATRLTATGNLIGTLSYIAPEVKAGERAEPRSDLYACGIVLRDGLSEHDPDRVRRLVEALTEHEPAARPRDAAQALELLERRSFVVEPTKEIEPEPTASFVAPPPPPVRPAARRPQAGPPPQPPAPPAPGGSRLPLAIGGAVAALAAVAVAVILLSGGDDGGSGPRKRQASGGAGTTAKQSVAEAPTSTATSTPTTTAETSTTPATTVATTASVDPARGVALNNQGYALLQSGDVASALPKLREAVASFPEDSTQIDYAYALFNYAQALRMSGDPAAAIPLLEKRLAISDYKVDVVQAELDLAKQEAGQG